MRDGEERSEEDGRGERMRAMEFFYTDSKIEIFSDVSYYVHGSHYLFQSHFFNIPVISHCHLNRILDF